MDRIRLSIDITKGQKRFIDQIPYGWKRPLFSAIIDILIEISRKEGHEVLARIASKNFNFTKDLKQGII